MSLRWNGVAATAALGLTLAFSGTPASAQVAKSPGVLQHAAGAAANGVTQVQWRRGRHWRRHGHWRGRHWRGGRYYGYGYRGIGPGVAFGLATGAIVGGAIAADRAARGADVHEYCANRFRSYDPASGTYLGYDGDRHPCP